MKIIKKTDTFLYLILFGTCIFVLLQSPLAPFAKSINGVDSSVFIYSAKHILDGQLIYKDIVDHKGPFLYFSYYLPLPTHKKGNKMLNKLTLNTKITLLLTPPHP